MKQPRKYQQRAIDVGIDHNFLNSDQMGLGKSLPSILVCEEIFNTFNAPALIICPKGIKLQWHDFILDQVPTARIWIATNDPHALLHTLDDYDYIIMHYELVTMFNDIISKQKWSTIVCDEAHRIKTRTTQKRLIETKKHGKRIHTTKAIKNLKSYRKLALTGTPFDKNPAEIWSILNWLAPNDFTSYWDFVEKYVGFSLDFFGHKKNYFIKDPKVFTDMLRPYMLRRTKKMVMPELPPMQVTRVPIELGQTQRKAYETIKHVVDMEVNFDELSEPMFIQHALTKLVRLLQCASDPAGIGLAAASAKLDWLIDWCADNPHEPVLIFSRYRTTAERAAAVLGADVLIMGGSELKRPLVSAQRIVATIGAAAVGFDLGHLTTAIFIDCDFSSILMQQSMERIDRGGNTEPKQVIILHAVNTADDLVKLALEHKWDTRKLIDEFLAMEQTHEIPSTV